MTIKKIAGRKFNFKDDSTLFVCMIESSYIDQTGQKYIKVKWVQTEKEVDLGSFAKPNTEILKVEYRVPKKEPSGFLKDLFGGLK